MSDHKLSLNSAFLERTFDGVKLSEEQRPIGGTHLVPTVEEERAARRVQAILATARELGISLSPRWELLLRLHNRPQRLTSKMALAMPRQVFRCL